MGKRTEAVRTTQLKELSWPYRGTGSRAICAVISQIQLGLSLGGGELIGRRLRRGRNQADDGFRQFRSTMSVWRQGHEVAQSLENRMCAQHWWI
jgi:hypothetical protein